jgi:hypothetical protein
MKIALAFVGTFGEKSPNKTHSSPMQSKRSVIGFLNNRMPESAVSRNCPSDAGALIGDVAQSAVQTGPTLRLYFPLQACADLLLAARTKLQRRALGCAIAKTATYVFAAYDQVLPVTGPATNEDMDVRIFGVPMVDRQPVELGAEIFLDIEHQLASESFEIPSSAPSSGETMKRK